MCEVVYESSKAVSGMSFESAIIIILTALAIMLAILAIGIAVMAIWGYAGFKDFVREAAKKHVAEAMTTKMKEYPEGARVLEAMQQLIVKTDLLEKLQNQLVTAPASKNIESASKSTIQGTAEGKATVTAAGTVLASIEPYPGEEPKNASDHPAETTNPSPATDNTGADHS
jgi:Na+-transporting methylmalonyl-CoA/oxaloacetate decarboxylase gamma subunit